MLSFSLVLLAAFGPLSLAFQSPRNPLVHRTAPHMSSAAAAVEGSDESLFQPAGEREGVRVDSVLFVLSSDDLVSLIRIISAGREVFIQYGPISS